MIVPRTKMIYWAALVMLPVAVSWAATPAAWAPGAVVFLGLLGACVIDALRVKNSLRGVHARLPELFRLTKDREGVLSLRIEGAKLPRRAVLAIEFPAEITPLYEQQSVTFPEEAGDGCSLEWPCTGTKRGRFRAGPVYLETVSPWGLWVVRGAVETYAEVRVYPNILRERKDLAALFLNRGNIGIHAQRQVGKGRELERLRDYAPGDLYEDISWKATAKRGRPISKVYQVERTQEVYVLLDTSRLSAREVTLAAHGPESKTPESVVSQLERFMTSAMILGLVAERQGDLFGVAAFDDRIRAFIRARNGKSHYSACRDALYALEPSGTNPDFGELFAFVRLHLRRRALLVILTNLDDPILSEQFLRNVDMLAGHHLLLVNMVQAPSVRPMFSAPGASDTNDVYAHLAGHIQWQGLRELEAVLGRRGVRFALLNHETMATQVVSQYINVKQRQNL